MQRKIKSHPHWADGAVAFEERFHTLPEIIQSKSLRTGERARVKILLEGEEQKQTRDKISRLRPLFGLARPTIEEAIRVFMSDYIYRIAENNAAFSAPTDPVPDLNRTLRYIFPIANRYTFDVLSQISPSRDQLRAAELLQIACRQIENVMVFFLGKNVRLSNHTGLSSRTIARTIRAPLGTPALKALLAILPESSIWPQVLELRNRAAYQQTRKRHLDQAVRSLREFFMKRTGKPCDSSVAAIAEALSGRHYDEPRVRMNHLREKRRLDDVYSQLKELAKESRFKKLFSVSSLPTTRTPKVTPTRLIKSRKH